VRLLGGSREQIAAQCCLARFRDGHQQPGEGVSTCVGDWPRSTLKVPGIGAWKWRSARLRDLVGPVDEGCRPGRSGSTTSGRTASHVARYARSARVASAIHNTAKPHTGTPYRIANTFMSSATSCSTASPATAPRSPAAVMDWPRGPSTIHSVGTRACARGAVQDQPAPDHRDDVQRSHQRQPEHRIAAVEHGLTAGARWPCAAAVAHPSRPFTIGGTTGISHPPKAASGSNVVPGEHEKRDGDWR